MPYKQLQIFKVQENEHTCEHYLELFLEPVVLSGGVEVLEK